MLEAAHLAYASFGGGGATREPLLQRHQLRLVLVRLEPPRRCRRRNAHGLYLRHARGRRLGSS